MSATRWDILAPEIVNTLEFEPVLRDAPRFSDQGFTIEWHAQ